MKILKPTVLFLGLLFSMTLMANSIDEQKSVEPNGVIKIKSLRGDIKIEGWENHQIRVSGNLDDLSTGLRFEVDGDRVEIEVEMPRGNVSWGNGSDLVIQVPSMSRVMVDSVSTDVNVENLRDGLQLRTISGEVDLDGVAGKITVKTVSGEIQSDSTSGRFRASSSSGSISVKTHQGDVEVETMSGEVDVEARGVAILRSSTMSGEIDVNAHLTQDVFAELTSVSGEITLTIEDPDDLTIVANTTSGKIDNDVTKDKVKEAWGQSSLEATLGNGSGRVNVRAVSGNIEIKEG